jgi:hypothetical protein
MFRPFPSHPSKALDYSVLDLLTVATCGATLAGWIAVCVGSFSVAALLMCELSCLSFYLAGSLVGSWRRFSSGLLPDLPFRLLAGYAVVNTALFALAWLSPLGIVANFSVLLAVTLVIFVTRRPTRAKSRSGGIGPWVVLLCLAATTLWCQDSLQPIQQAVDGLRFKPWMDGFYHAVHVRIFGAAHGASTIEDFRMAGVPARLYHYAAYLTPALIKQASGITAYSAFAAIQVPLGVCFTGLAAYVLVASFWGPIAGLLASTALLFLPDGVQQGTESPLLSYHWLSQISPGATFGIAVVALAWLFVIRGCQRGSRWQIAAGWVVGGLVTFYKAQFFIASALPLAMVPPLFMRGRLRRWHRAVWGTGTVTAYAGCIALTQKLPDFPLIRLDGSATTWLFDVLNRASESAPLKAFTISLIGSGQPWLMNLVFGPVYLLTSVFGAFLLLFIALAIAVRKQIAPVLRWFPFLLTANFLVMAMGLALDSRGVGTPEELLHRPFLLMYFAVVAWIGGAAGAILTRSSLWSRHIVHVIVLVLPLPLLMVPADLGPGVQLLTKTAGMSNQRVSPGLRHATEVMRIEGKPDDIFQDSSFDRFYLAAAMSERRPYVEHMVVHVRHNDDKVKQRTAQITDLMSTPSRDAVVAKLKTLGIRWFLLHPGHQVAWPPEIAGHPILDVAGFRLYRFD